MVIDSIVESLLDPLPRSAVSWLSRWTLVRSCSRGGGGQATGVQVVDHRLNRQLDRSFGRRSRAWLARCSRPAGARPHRRKLHGPPRIRTHTAWPGLLSIREVVL